MFELFDAKDKWMLCLASERLTLLSTSDCRTAIRNIEK